MKLPRLSFALLLVVASLSSGLRAGVIAFDDAYGALGLAPVRPTTTRV